MPTKKKRKKSKFEKRRIARGAGARFELKVRNELESEGWIVDKWSNNVNLEGKKLVKVKNKFLGPGKPMMLGAGFPDFIVFKLARNKGKNYKIIGVEARSDGKLKKDEKEKCRFLLDKKIFSNILVAKKGKKRGKIEYIDFKKKYNNL